MLCPQQHSPPPHTSMLGHPGPCCSRAQTQSSRKHMMMNFRVTTISTFPTHHPRMWVLQGQGPYFNNGHFYVCVHLLYGRWMSILTVHFNHLGLKTKTKKLMVVSHLQRFRCNWSGESPGRRDFSELPRGPQCAALAGSRPAGLLHVYISHSLSPQLFLISPKDGQSLPPQRVLFRLKKVTHCTLN